MLTVLGSSATNRPLPSLVSGTMADAAEAGKPQSQARSALRVPEGFENVFHAGFIRVLKGCIRLKVVVVLWFRVVVFGRLQIFGSSGYMG